MALGPIIGGLLIGGTAPKMACSLRLAQHSLWQASRSFSSSATWITMPARGKTGQPEDSFQGHVQSRAAQSSGERYSHPLCRADSVCVCRCVAVNSNGLTALRLACSPPSEMVTAMLVYIPVANLSDKYGKALRLITFGFLPHFRLCFCSHIHFRCLGCVYHSWTQGIRRADEKSLIMDLRRRQQRRAPSAFTIIIRMSLYQLRHFRALRSGISPRQSIFLLLQGSGLQASSFLRYLERT